MSVILVLSVVFSALITKYIEKPIIRVEDIFFSGRKFLERTSMKKI
jgi:peptidoglycan/LPS O-acetylase OafA/YrhL